MSLRVGTSGYSYKEWKGSFYPEDLKEKDMLRYYAERFGTVEINNTFYRMPTAPLLARWAEQTPPAFTFVLKAPGRITHRKRLADVKDDLTYLFDAAYELGPKLGPVLFQLPPYLQKDVPRLTEFLGLLPVGRPVAFEFRHASWFEDEVFEALRAHDVALCVADVDEEGLPEAPLATAGWGYLRLRRAEYSDDDLARWADRIAGQSWRDAYVFFKHEDAGRGPDFAARFTRLATGDRGPQA